MHVARSWSFPIFRSFRRNGTMKPVVSGVVLVAVGLFAWPLGAAAAQPPVGLGTVAPFAVIAGSTVTNTGSSSISGDVGVSPGTSMTGFPPGQMTSGTQHAADAVALQAQADLTTAYNDAAGRTPVTTVTADLGGQTLAPGVYNASSALGLTGTVTLDGQANANAVFILQAGSTLITAPNSTVSLINGAQACNVFWQVGSSATLGTDTTFAGTVMALSSATLQTGSTVNGRILARNGAVTLDDNTITDSACALVTPTVTGVSPSSGSTSGGTTVTITGTGFTGATGVDFGSTPGTGVTVVSPTQITAVSPPGTVGSVPVTVITPGGTSGGGPGSTFTFTGIVTTTATPTTTPGTPAGTTSSTTPGSPATTGAGVPVTAVVPLGAPQTGAGGASRSDNPALVVLGALALLGAAVVTRAGVLRRRPGPIDARDGRTDGTTPGDG